MEVERPVEGRSPGAGGPVIAAEDLFRPTAEELPRSAVGEVQEPTLRQCFGGVAG